MKVKLLVSRCGPGAASAGDIIDVSDEEAKRMFEAMPPQAEPVRETRKAEKAVKNS